jgi:hypothetical protein
MAPLLVGKPTIDSRFDRLVTLRQRAETAGLKLLYAVSIGILSHFCLVRRMYSARAKSFAACVF